MVHERTGPEMRELMESAESCSHGNLGLCAVGARGCASQTSDMTGTVLIRRCAFAASVSEGARYVF